MLVNMIVKSSKWRNKEKPSWAFLPIHLTAQNPTKNIYRFYTIFTSKDLFGFTCVHTCYGRIGTKGRLKSYAFEKESKATIFLNHILKKRLNSSKRIGVNYKKF